MSAAQDLGGGGEFVLLDTIEVLRARGMTVRVLNLAPAPGALVRVLASRGIATRFCRIGRFRSVATAARVLSHQVLIEAMACGKPIVATRGGGVPEMVEHEVTGYVIPPRHAAELATRLEMLSDPATRSRLGQAGRHRAERLFGLAGYGEQLHAVVDGVVGRRR